MSELSPKVAAELAKEVYFVQDEFTIEAIMSRPEFSKKAGDKKPMKATVGSRLVNTQDGFGLCALGGKGYENDIFLIFRGSTSANHNADWVSNFRIGVEYSRTGLPVHVGFNHIFGACCRAFANSSKHTANPREPFTALATAWVARWQRWSRIGFPVIKPIP